MPSPWSTALEAAYNDSPQVIAYVNASVGFVNAEMSAATTEDTQTTADANAQADAAVTADTQALSAAGAAVDAYNQSVVAADVADNSQAEQVQSSYDNSITNASKTDATDTVQADVAADNAAASTANDTVQSEATTYVTNVTTADTAHTSTVDAAMEQEKTATDQALTSGFGADETQEEDELSAANAASQATIDAATAGSAARKADVLAAFDWRFGTTIAAFRASYEGTISNITTEVASIESGATSVTTLTLAGTPSDTFTYHWQLPSTIAFMASNSPITLAGSYATTLNSWLPGIQSFMGLSDVPAGELFSYAILSGSQTLALYNRAGVTLGDFNPDDGIVHLPDPLQLGVDHPLPFTSVMPMIGASDTPAQVMAAFGIAARGAIPDSPPDPPLSTGLSVLTWVIGEARLARPGTGIVADLLLTTEIVTDVTSMLDPTPCSDLLNASVKYAQGDNLGAAASLVSAAVPFGVTGIINYGAKLVPAATKAATKLTIEATEQVAKHADDAAKVVIQHADEALGVVKTYADEVAQLLSGKADDVAKQGDNIVTKADDTLYDCLDGSNCFTGDTPVMTSKTSSKRIDQIRAGDVVLSRSEFDPEGAPELKRVEEVFNRVGRLVRIRVNGRDIMTTDEHPFDVAGVGWTAAEALKPGQRLLTHDNRLVTIDVVEATKEVAPVFNFRVADFHTYYVGAPEWGFDVWVHNSYTRNSDGTFTVTTTTGSTRTFQNEADLNHWIAENRGKSTPLPSVDKTSKLHGELPDLESLSTYSRDDLEYLLKQLPAGGKGRNAANAVFGRELKHGDRQAAEQALRFAILKLLGRS